VTIGSTGVGHLQTSVGRKAVGLSSSHVSRAARPLRTLVGPSHLPEVRDASHARHSGASGHERRQRMTVDEQLTISVDRVADTVVVTLTGEMDLAIERLETG
jgi:hypothetical protein